MHLTHLYKYRGQTGKKPYHPFAAGIVAFSNTNNIQGSNNAITDDCNAINYYLHGKKAGVLAENGQGNGVNYQYFIANYQYFIKNYQYFMAKYQYFVANYQYFIKNYQYFIAKYRYFVANYQYFIKNYQYFMAKYQYFVINYRLFLQFFY